MKHALLLTFIIVLAGCLEIEQLSYDCEHENLATIDLPEESKEWINYDSIESMTFTDNKNESIHVTIEEQHIWCGTWKELIYNCVDNKRTKLQVLYRPECRSFQIIVDRRGREIIGVYGLEYNIESELVANEESGYRTVSRITVKDLVSSSNGEYETSTTLFSTIAEGNELDTLNSTLIKRGKLEIGGLEYNDLYESVSNSYGLKVIVNQRRGIVGIGNAKGDWIYVE